MANSDKFVFRAEYAASDRSSCKLCGNGIHKDKPRLAIMVQSRHHDGLDAQWHHPRCFFKQKPRTHVDEIKHFHDLRWCDQEEIRDLAEQSNTAAKKSKGKKRSKVEADGEDELDESNGTATKKRKLSAEEEELKRQNDMLYTARDLAASMTKPDQKFLLEVNKQHVPTQGEKILDRLADMLAFGPPDYCKLSHETEDDGQDEVVAEPKKPKKVPKKKRKKLDSDENDSEEEEEVKVKTPKKREKKEQLKLPFLVISADAYYCIGVTAGNWAKCSFKTQEPQRRRIVIPDKLAKKYDFLENYRTPPLSKRVFAACFRSSTSTTTVVDSSNGLQTVTTTATYDEDCIVIVDDGPSTSAPKAKPNGQAARPSIQEPPFDPAKPLTNLRIAAAGTLRMKREQMKQLIHKLGRDFVQKCDGDVFVVISSEKNIEQRPVLLEMAEACHIHVVPVEFLDECKDKKLKKASELYNLVKQMAINPWTASEPSSRIDQLELARTNKGLSSTEMHRLEEKRRNALLESHCDDKLKLIVKNGAAVDPDSDLNDENHSVYRSGRDIYTCVLNKVDVQMGSNSYYRMQIIQHDTRKNYHLFRAWGRLGTTTGGVKCDPMDLDEAIQQFEFHFKDKTANQWRHRQNFKKQPMKYFMLDIDYGSEEPEEDYRVQPGSRTRLHKAVQDLLKMIFDVESFKRTMKTFEIDMKKMPLGKISRNQIKGAMEVLVGLQRIFDENREPSETEGIASTNHFYAKVPHDFGTRQPILLRTRKQIMDKLEMLESLLEIETAISMMRGENRESEVDPLDQDSEQYKLIVKYLKNTHAPTHSNYTLELLEVFQVNRNGESKRFEEFKSLHNHKLLWHGSRVTNYAGILSQGLRIAPPEAPVTGYMFGKGVYFADMISKSANYCFTNRENDTGLVLLSDLALGNMWEFLEARSVVEPQKGYHSVKDCGKTAPDPSQAVIGPDGAEVPLGTPKTVASVGSLLYNEYIVYKEAQVNLKYLLKVKFNFNY